MIDADTTRSSRSISLEAALRPHFAEVRAYQQNSRSIRARVIDPRFEGKSFTERERLVLPYLASLPIDVQADVTMLLLLTPDEVGESLVNLEFEQPLQSQL
jgi:hypothetical protein